MGLSDLKVVTQRQPSDQELADPLFTWRRGEVRQIQRHRSRPGRQTIRVGAGQMSRVFSARIAGMKAKRNLDLKVPGLVGSDAFFPFRDGIDLRPNTGSPPSSSRVVRCASEVIAAADEHGARCWC